MVAARKSALAKPNVLVASDNVGDAALVKNLLAHEFDQVFVSTNTDLAVEEFEAHGPDVLLLAFNTLQKAELYYLGLFRLSGKIHQQAHRTVVLCNREEVNQAYQACKKKYFDDYVLFWPMGNDAPRLPMAVHHALRALSGAREAGPTVAEFAVQARQLAGLGSMLDQQVAAAAENPTTQWAEEFRKEYKPHVDSVRTLNALADSIQPVIMVVDDDQFQRRILSKLLEEAGYKLVFAGGGIEALNILRDMRPDLILMDVMMPGLDGIETTRRLKAVPQFAAVPVIMITGKTEGATVRDSLKAGANNFVVKPFDREILLAKVARALHPVPVASPVAAGD